MSPSRPPDLLVIGDVNPDVIVTGVAQPVPFGQAERLVEAVSVVIGGSAAITAAGAARLGAWVELVGVLGADPFGALVADLLAARGVGLRGVRRDLEQPTGVSVILDSGADRAILTAPGAIGSLRAGDLDSLPDRPARHVHVASYFLLDPEVRAALPGHLGRWRAAGVTTSVDTNHDPEDAWDLGDLLDHVDVFLPNETEVERFGAAAVAEVPELVVTRGAAGATVRTVGGEHRSAPPPSVDYADATGAGDSLTAGYLVARAEGRPPEEALDWGVCAGTLSTRGRGGTAAQPTRAELLAAVPGHRP